jgi:hypothetical protein
MKIHLVQAEFHEDEQTDMTKLMVTFRNIVKVHKKLCFVWLTVGNVKQTVLCNRLSPINPAPFYSTLWMSGSTVTETGSLHSVIPLYTALPDFNEMNPVVLEIIQTGMFCIYTLHTQNTQTVS